MLNRLLWIHEVWLADNSCLKSKFNTRDLGDCVVRKCPVVLQSDNSVVRLSHYIINPCCMLNYVWTQHWKFIIITSHTIKFWKGNVLSFFIYNLKVMYFALVLLYVYLSLCVYYVHMFAAWLCVYIVCARVCLLGALCLESFENIFVSLFKKGNVILWF